MPRGYLKHNSAIGRKKARGGSSGRGYVSEKDHDIPRDRIVIEDFVIDTPNNSDYKKNVDSRAPNHPVLESVQFVLRSAPGSLPIQQVQMA